MSSVSSDALLSLLQKRWGSGGTYLRDNRGRYSGQGEICLSHLFDQQRALVTDPRRRKLLACGRRGGKTEALAAFLGRAAENYSNSLNIYICRTAAQAVDIIWPALKRLAYTHKLSWKFNAAKHIVTAANGSMIIVTSADKAENIERFRGLAPTAVAIDEAGTFREIIESLIEKIILPSLTDFNGELVMAGTPGREGGYFHKAWMNKIGIWAVHRWTVLDNPYHPQWRDSDGAPLPDWKQRAMAMLASEMRENGWSWDHPTFQREWLANWISDVSEKLYKFDPRVNTTDELPPGDWSFVLGIDIGKNLAFVLCAWQPGFPVYVVWAEKHDMCPMEKWAEIGRRIEAPWASQGYEVHRVIDVGGLGGEINGYLGRQHGYWCAPAVKTNKEGYIREFNDELQAGRILLVRDTTAPYIKELTKLACDEYGFELPRSDNHCCDAALYASRKCYAYLPAKDRGPPQAGDPGYEEHRNEQLFEQLQSPAGDYSQESLEGWLSESGGTTSLRAWVQEGWGGEFGDAGAGVHHF